MESPSPSDDMKNEDEDEVIEEILVVLEFEHEKNQPMQIRPGQKISILVI